MQRLNLQKALVGTDPVGPDRRWAKQFLEKKKCDDGDAQILMNHLAAVDSAMALSGGMIAKLPEETLVAHIKVLCNHSMDWPTSAKTELLDRAVARWSEKPDRFHEINELLDTIVPWSGASGCDDECAESSFNPLAPRASAMEGSALDKANTFKNTLVKRILVPLMQGGASTSDSVLLFCMAVLRRIMAAEDIDEAYGEAVHDLFRILRAVGSLVQGHYVEAAGARDLDFVIAATSQKSSRNVASVVGAAVQQIPYYTERVEFLHKFALATKESKPKVEAAMQQLVGDPMLLREAIRGAIELLESLKGRTAPGSLTSLEQAAEKQVLPSRC